MNNEERTRLENAVKNIATGAIILLIINYASEPVLYLAGATAFIIAAYIFGQAGTEVIEKVKEWTSKQREK